MYYEFCINFSPVATMYSPSVSVALAVPRVGSIFETINQNQPSNSQS